MNRIRALVAAAWLAVGGCGREGLPDDPGVLKAAVLRRHGRADADTCVIVRHAGDWARIETYAARSPMPHAIVLLRREEDGWHIVGAEDFRRRATGWADSLGAPRHFADPPFDSWNPNGPNAGDIPRRRPIGTWHGEHFAFTRTHGDSVIEVSNDSMVVIAPGRAYVIELRTLDPAGIPVDEIAWRRLRELQRQGRAFDRLELLGMGFPGLRDAFKIDRVSGDTLESVVWLDREAPEPVYVARTTTTSRAALYIAWTFLQESIRSRAWDPVGWKRDTLFTPHFTADPR